MGQGALYPCYLWLFPETFRKQQRMSSNLEFDVDDDRVSAESQRVVVQQVCVRCCC